MFGAELVGARFDQRVIPADPRDLSRGPRRESRRVPLSRTPKIGRLIGSWAGVWKCDRLHEHPSPDMGRAFHTAPRDPPTAPNDHLDFALYDDPEMELRVKLRVPIFGKTRRRT
ncbi:hypothetical protein LTR35_015491 [Friedmanniomyces endolithicus]|nr:hypothetical protein LTR35_015491 [Friedmanniomyces endolithicus]KAK0276391.1 hypothetical protein LTS00_014651 [Friedmanniomyces endolithicus]KAK1017105.1 hypothetical protein LTR54_002481 [Friedmanniomyces endolithicus]